MFQLALKELRERHNLTQAELAKMLQVSQSTVGMWEAGKNLPTYKTLLKIADIFRVSVDELTNVDRPWPGLQIAVYDGKISPGTFFSHYEYVQQNQFANDGLLGLILQTTEMQPSMHPGDILLIAKQRHFDSGDLVAYNQDHFTHVRRLYRLEQGIILCASEPSYAPLYIRQNHPSGSSIKMLGKVVELRRRSPMFPDQQPCLPSVTGPSSNPS